jgi:hypothetical protein
MLARVKLMFYSLWAVRVELIHAMRGKYFNKSMIIPMNYAEFVMENIIRHGHHHHHSSWTSSSSFVMDIIIIMNPSHKLYWIVKKMRAVFHTSYRASGGAHSYCNASSGKDGYWTCVRSGGICFSSSAYAFFAPPPGAPGATIFAPLFYFMSQTQTQTNFSQFHVSCFIIAESSSTRPVINFTQWTQWFFFSQSFWPFDQ